MKTRNGINWLITPSVRRFILTPVIVAAVLAASSLGQTNKGIASSNSALTAASFQPIGQGPKGSGAVWSRAWGVSSDGTVVGTFVTPNGVFFETRAFRWSDTNGFQDLGTLNPPDQEAEAYGVSDDGSKVVGWSRGVSGYERPYLWTATAGMQELSEVPGSDAYAVDISRDGSVIVGAFYVDAEGSWHAFRMAGKQVTDLGFLMMGTDSKGHAVCGLGAAAVGSTVDRRGVQRAFRWKNQKMVALRHFALNAVSYAEGCSDNGKVVVGTSSDKAGNLLAARWSPTGLLSLGTLGGNMSEAHAVSADGSIVVGAAGLPSVDGASQFAAFRWTSAKGTEQLSKVLESLLGVNNVQFCHQVPCPAGTWFIDMALGVSANGTVIVGTTWDPNLPFPNNEEAFRAVVPTAP